MNVMNHMGQCVTDLERSRTFYEEALGFCAIGEGKDFVDGGTRIALDGDLPLNPHGGQLSAGRTHGYGFVHEAAVQLRGEGGARQVDGARLAVVSTGGGTPGGCFLLRSA